MILALVIGFVGFSLWSGWMPRWLGRLPGDIRIERGQSFFYFPVVTCIILSLLVSLLLSFFRR